MSGMAVSAINNRQNFGKKEKKCTFIFYFITGGKDPYNEFSDNEGRHFQGKFKNFVQGNQIEQG
jgi:hypothetical protein